MVNMDQVHEVEDCSNLEAKTGTTELATIPQADTQGDTSVAENPNEVSNDDDDKVKEFVDEEISTPKSADDVQREEDLVEDNEVGKEEDACDDVQFEEKNDKWKLKIDIYSSTSSSSNEDSELEDPKNLNSDPPSEKCSDSVEQNQQCNPQDDPNKSESESEFLGFEVEPDPTAMTAIYQKLIAKSEAAVDIDKWSSCSGSVTSASSDYNSDDGDQSNVSLQGREKYETYSERDEDDVSSTSKNNNDLVDYGENGGSCNFIGGSFQASPPGTKRTDGYHSIMNKGKRQLIDLNSPAFKLPFTMGWKREVVYRSTVDGGANNKRLADIYYYTPTGKKMRSTREVLEFLEDSKSPLSVDNFTFLKDCVRPDDPSLEIIREAKKISIRDDGGKRKSRSKSSTPTMGSPHPDWTSESSSPRKGKSTPIHVGSYPLKGGSRRRIYPGHGADYESGLYSPPWSNIPGSSSPRYEGDNVLWSGMSKKNPDTIMPCSIRCPGLSGVVPTLQCQICVCLYHPECVGGIPLHVSVSSYVCKNCDRDTKENHAEGSSAPGKQTIPPPLVPIDRLGKTSPTHGYSPSAPPRLQRFPQLHMDGRGDQRTISNSSYVPGVTVYARNRPPVFIRGVVGNSGSPRSNIGMNFPDSFTREPTVGQSVAIMQGRKYVVVPKNVLSVLPGAANAAAAAAAAFSGGNISRGSVIPISREWLCSQPGVKSTTVKATGGTFIPPSPIQPTSPQPFMSSNPASSIPGLIKAREMKPQYVIISSPMQSNMADSNKDGDASSASSVVTPRTSESNDNGIAYRPMEENQVPRKRKLTLLRDDQPSSKRVKKSHTNGYSPAKKDSVVVMDEDEFSEEESNDVPKQKRLARKDMFSENFMNNLSSGYTALLHVFHYLNVQDLLRAAMVCRLWRDLAGGHHSLWRTVRMKNSQVGDWVGFADTLARNRTEILDLRKMLLPPSGPSLSSASGTEDVSGSKGRDRRSQWGQEFCRAISRASGSLRRLELCRCGMDVLEGVASSCPLLTVLGAQAIRSYELNLEFVGKLSHLQELRLKSPSGMNLIGDLSSLEGLVSLKHLSITTVTDLAGDNGERLSVLTSLTNLESLELGECSAFGEEACKAIGNLQNLTRLRLEKGEVGERLGGRSLLDNENDVVLPGLLEALVKLPLLVQLELVNFDIGLGFDTGLEKCTRLQRLLIIPNYVAQSATSNKMVLSGAMKLSRSLNTFTWGVTHEVLQAIELFVASDNADGKKRNSSSDEDPEEGRRSGHRGKTLPSSECLPILKPLPFVSEEDKESKVELEETEEDDKFSRVEFVPLSKLHGLLSEAMPNTKVQIVKMPFSATWRQGISEVDL